MTPFAILILFTIIPIQMIVAPSVSSGEEIGGVPKTEVQSFLGDNEYIEKIFDMFTTAKASASQANKKLKQYSKTKLPEDLKTLFGNIANAPYAVYEQMEPMLEDLKKKGNELDNTLESESLAYRMVAKPAWGVFSGLGYVGLSILGYSVNTVGTLAQLFSTGAKEGVIAYNDGKLPDGQAKQVFDRIEGGVDKIKGWGNKMGEHASAGLQKSRIRRTDTNKNTEPETHDEGKHKDKDATNHDEVPAAES